MIFHDNRLLADDSHVLSYLFFVQKLGKITQNLSSAAVVIGALRVRYMLKTLVDCTSNTNGIQNCVLLAFPTAMETT